MTVLTYSVRPSVSGFCYMLIDPETRLVMLGFAWGIVRNLLFLMVYGQAYSQMAPAQPVVACLLLGTPPRLVVDALFLLGVMFYAGHDARPHLKEMLIVAALVGSVFLIVAAYYSPSSLIHVMDPIWTTGFTLLAGVVVSYSLKLRVLTTAGKRPRPVLWLGLVMTMIGSAGISLGLPLQLTKDAFSRLGLPYAVEPFTTLVTVLYCAFASCLVFGSSVNVGKISENALTVVLLCGFLLAVIGSQFMASPIMVGVGIAALLMSGPMLGLTYWVRERAKHLSGQDGTWLLENLGGVSPGNSKVTNKSLILIRQSKSNSQWDSRRYGIHLVQSRVREQ